MRHELIKETDSVKKAIDNFVIGYLSDSVWYENNKEILDKYPDEKEELPEMLEAEGRRRADRNLIECGDILMAIKIEVDKMRGEEQC